MDVKIDLTRTRIETERLLLRFWKLGDLDDFYEYASVDGVGEKAGWPHHITKEETLRILAMFINGKDCMAVVYKQNMKVIGSIGLHSTWASDDPKYSALRAKDLGYVLSKEYWGKGLIPEAARALIAYSFDELGLDAITCMHYDGNDQSRRVIEKCGFSFVKDDMCDTQFGTAIPGKKYILLR